MYQFSFHCIHDSSFNFCEKDTITSRPCLWFIDIQYAMSLQLFEWELEGPWCNEQRVELLEEIGSVVTDCVRSVYERQDNSFSQ